MNLPEAFFVSSIAELSGEIGRMVQKKPLFLLTDENVSNAWLSDFLYSLNEHSEADVIEISAGESSKNLETCSQIWSHLLESNAGRDAVIINLGGGVITDLGGFVGSTYKRGIPFIHVPTSLMAMVDAAIGGKTGIDHDNVKNAVGTFHPPAQILIWPEFLSSLPETELRSGFAEMLKHALITDVLMWNSLIAKDHKDYRQLIPLIEKATRIKEEIVVRDPYETGERKLLNLGHSIGHAVESCFLRNGEHISHGDAIAFGIMTESLISSDLNIADETTIGRIAEGILKHFSFNPKSFPPTDTLLTFLLNDKKNRSGKILMTLPERIGKAQTDIAVNEETVVSNYQKMLSLLE